MRDRVKVRLLSVAVGVTLVFVAPLSVYAAPNKPTKTPMPKVDVVRYQTLSFLNGDTQSTIGGIQFYIDNQNRK